MSYKKNKQITTHVTATEKKLFFMNCYSRGLTPSIVLAQFVRWFNIICK